MADYQFSTVWRVEASIQEVWDVFFHPDSWPEWWGSLERIVEIRKGDLRGIGALHRYTWKGALPYRLTFDINVLKIRPCTLLEGQASGAVEGRGVWSFTANGTATIVRYDWNVRTTPLDELSRPAGSTCISLESQYGHARGGKRVSPQTGNDCVYSLNVSPLLYFFGCKWLNSDLAVSHFIHS